MSALTDELTAVNSMLSLAEDEQKEELEQNQCDRFIGMFESTQMSLSLSNI